MTPHGPLLSIVIPVFRNRGTITVLHRRTTQALESCGITWEIIFVDDASDDCSADRIRGLMSGDAAVRLLSHRTNRGQQRAVLTGMRAARGDLLATLDADLQDPPEALPLLLRQIGGSVDAVFATRTGAYESAGRLRTSRLFKWLLRQVCGVPRNAGMFVMMTAATVRAILALRPSPFYLPTAVMAVTHRVAAVPVERALRLTGVSQYTMLSRTRVGLTALLSAVWWRVRRRPDAQQ